MSPCIRIKMLQRIIARLDELNCLDFGGVAQTVANETYRLDVFEPLEHERIARYRAAL